MENLDVLLIASPSPNAALMESYRYQGMPPLGLGYIATYLKEYGYSVKILDMAISEVTIHNVMEVISSDNPPIVGISTTTETYQSGIRIAGMIKEKYPYTIIVMGGCHVTFQYADALETSVIDYVIRGEGEITFKRLCDYILCDRMALDEIDGLSYTKNGEIISNRNAVLCEDIDRLPYPDRNFFDLSKYPLPATCSTSRGCPGKCIFCAASALAGGKYRMRCARSIVDEFKYLSDMGFSRVDIVDDTMTASVKRISEFTELLVKEKVRMSWYCESRVDIMTKDLLRNMQRAGLTWVQFGVEAASQHMLDCLKKNITMDQINRVFSWCKELGINCSTNMIIGQPYDTRESIQETIKLAQTFAVNGVMVNFSICTPYPGTYMWNHLEELGLKIVEDNLDYYTTLYPVCDTRHLSANEIRNFYFEAVKAVREVSRFRENHFSRRTEVI